MIGALTDQTVLLNNQSQLTKLKIQDQKFEDTDQQKKGYSHIVSTDVISYDMLVEQFFDELLIDEYIKLEDNAEEIAEGIADKIAVDIAKEFADNNSDTLELKIKKYRDALYETTDETNQLRRKLLGFWNETVKSKINECKENILRPNEQDKETLRNNLLSILYKLRAINEYEKTLSGIITTPEAIEKSAIKTEAIKTEAIKYSIEYILNIKNNESFNYDLMPPIPKTLIYAGGAPKGARLTSPGAVRHITVPPPVQENFLMFCLNKWVKKMWKYLITLMEEPKLLIFDSSYRYSVDQRRYDIREKIREELKNKGVNINIVDEDFHIVDNDEQFRLKVAESQFYREQLDLAIQTAMEDHNSLATLLQIYPHTEWRGIYKPFQQLKIYGVDLPIQYNRGMLLGKMFYIVKNITTFVDLQDCENVSNRIFKVKVDGEYIYNGCNPYDRSVEREMFELACVVMKDKGIISNYSDKKFLNIKGYVDMTSGSYSAWDEISKIEDVTKNPTLIHCYAGKGRTGSVILFLILRDAKIYETKKLYDLGSQYKDPLVLIGELKNLFDISKSEGDNPGNYISYVVEEVFNTKKIWHIILLRQRLNRIFYFLAKHNNKKVFYLYADVAPRSDVYSEIVADERKKDKTLTDKDIQDIAYQKYISRKSEDEDITHEFSKPSKLTIDWGNIDESKIAQHKKYIDGFLT